MLPSPYFGCTFQPMFNCVCFPRAYIIKSFDLAMLSPCSHSCGNPSFGNLNGLSLSESVTSSPLLDLMTNPCLRTCFHSSFPENLTMSSRQLVLRLFFSGIPSLSYPDTHQIRISVRYDGWNIFPRVITFVST